MHACTSAVCGAHSRDPRTQRGLMQVVCKGDDAATIRLLAKISFARSASALLLLPALGRMSDRSGRKGMLVATALASALGHALTAAVPSAGTLLLGQALMGALGVGGASDAIRDASLADVFRGSALATATGKSRAYMALGMIVAPIISGMATR